MDPQSSADWYIASLYHGIFFEWTPNFEVELFVRYTTQKKNGFEIIWPSAIKCSPNRNLKKKVPNPNKHAVLWIRIILHQIRFSKFQIRILLELHLISKSYRFFFVIFIPCKVDFYSEIIIKMNRIE